MENVLTKLKVLMDISMNGKIHFMKKSAHDDGCFGYE